MSLPHINLPKDVTIVEVGPRDGLQNEPQALPTETKLKLISLLAAAGLSVIETTSFVPAKWVPQMADHSELMQQLKPQANIRYPVLIPNVHGLELALAAKVQDIAVLAAASETFSKKNTNCSIKQGIQRISDIIRLAKRHQLRVRAYISCVIDCPYEGHIEPAIVTDIAQQLLSLGCDEIALGETIGTATANQVEQLLDAVMQPIPCKQLAVHFHDTYGQALTNIYVSLQHGISTIDAAVAGLGGCPNAPGASGNVATEDVVYLLNGLGIHTGINLKQLIKAGQFICQQLKLQPRSRVAQAFS